MTLKFTILGCGNSSGVPAAGNHWGACDPEEPKNMRMRCSGVVQSDITTLVIDTGPEFRLQMNAAKIEMIDAVLYTHDHGDHMNGIDDLRVYRFRKKDLVDVYGNKETLSFIAKRFGYMINGGVDALYPPMLRAHEISKDMEGKPLKVGDIEFTSFTQDHGTCETLGYRFGDLAYSVDMRRLDEKALETLKGIKTWIVDCAAYHNEDNKVHSNIKEIYAYNEIIGAQHVYLTSLSLSMDYQTLKGELKDGYAPACDGLEIKADM